MIKFPAYNSPFTDSWRWALLYNTAEEQVHGLRGSPGKERSAGKDARKQKQHIITGGKILTEKRIYHNKPDIVISTSNPKHIYIIEVSVAHIQNFRLQEKIKRTRYEVNGAQKVDDANVNTITGDTNLITEMKQAHQCPVELGILVIVNLDEVILTEEHMNLQRILKKLGTFELNRAIMINQCSYSVVLSTSVP
ncbi:hypothetical protein HHI36_005482 [Cryptolaemus montrouzieri]|uniref:Uncharacterized protein n=1 Tax=Cryptolaemus montrouzieri TaxID=559131 RepID=A0ABD2NUT0_9CUCU